MSSIWTRSAVTIASAALISMAFIPALAQPEETQPPPEEVQAPPNETMPREVRQKDRVSRPSSEVGLARLQAGGRLCYSDAIQKGDAQKECDDAWKAAGHTCKFPAPCNYDKNRQEWRCTCT